MCASARNLTSPPPQPSILRSIQHVCKCKTQKLTYAHGLLWHVAPKTYHPQNTWWLWWPLWSLLLEEGAAQTLIYNYTTRVPIKNQDFMIHGLRWPATMKPCRFQDLEAWANAGFAWLCVCCVDDVQLPTLKYLETKTPRQKPNRKMVWLFFFAREDMLFNYSKLWSMRFGNDT